MIEILENNMLEFLSFAVGVIGIGIGIIQHFTARRVRSLYEEKCNTRCRDLVETVQELAIPVAEACRIKDENFDELLAGQFESPDIVRPIRILSDQIHTIYTSKNQLIRFCERLNQEHERDFGEVVFQNLRDRFAEYP